MVLRLWRGSLDVPFYLVGDNPLLLSATKGMLDNGWYFHNSFLGAPFGQDLIEFAGLGAENLQWVALWLLGQALGNAAALVNVYFLLSFPLIAAVSFLVMRDLCISRRAALVTAALFSVLPYHFAKAEAGHLQLATYVAVPLGAWLVVRVLMGHPLLRRHPDVEGLRAWLSWPNAAVVAACVVIGGSTLYYAVFTLLLLLMAAVLRALATRNWRGLIPGLALFAACAAVLFVNLLPGIIYRVSAGPNPALAMRTPWESQVYSLSLVQMLLPVPGHRVSSLARARETFANYSQVKGEGGLELGLVFSAGLVIGLVGLAVWVMRSGVIGSYRARVARSTSVGLAAAFLLGTFGGLSSLIAYFISPQIRAWGRLVPFIAFFSAVLVGLALDWLGRRARRRTRSTIWWSLACAVVLLVGAWDQTSPANIPAYAANRADWSDRQQFVRQVEREVPAGSVILQLPLFPFPESSGVAPVVGPYDPLFAYLHSSLLKWTWGAMKGRPEDWSDEAGRLGTRQLITAAAAAGFAGVYVDGGGYPDNGRAVGAEIRAASQPAPPTVVSRSGRFRFYDLRPARQRLEQTASPAHIGRLRTALVTPVGEAFGPGFYPEESDGANRWRWAACRAEMSFSNPAAFSQRVRFTAQLGGSKGSRVAVWYQGRLLRTLVLSGGGASLDLVLRIPPGSARLEFRTNGSDLAPPVESRELCMQFVNPFIGNLVFERYASP